MSENPVVPSQFTGPITDPVLLAHIQATQGEPGAVATPKYTSGEATAMAALTRPAKDIVLPGRFGAFKAKLWSLSGEEEVDAKDAAHDYLEERYKGKDLALRLASNPELLFTFQVCARLALALRRFNDASKPLFSMLEVFRFFTDPDRTHLNELLDKHIIESNPLTWASSHSEVMDLLETHLSGGEEALSTLLASCDENMARNIAVVLAAKWAGQRSESSSKK